MMMGDYKQVSNNCKTVLMVDSSFVEDYNYLFGCCLIVGDNFGAQCAFEQCEKFGSNNVTTAELTRKRSNLILSE